MKYVKCKKCGLPLRSHLHRYWAPECPPIDLIMDLQTSIKRTLNALGVTSNYIGAIANWKQP